MDRVAEQIPIICEKKGGVWGCAVDDVGPAVITNPGSLFCAESYSFLVLALRLKLGRKDFSSNQTKGLALWLSVFRVNSKSA